MSSDVLSEEQIAALVEAARDTAPAPGGGRAPGRRTPRVRAMNFERPTKFTSHQERRLGRLMESFCRTASTRLSAELRTAVELEFVGSTQLTWSSMAAHVPDGAACALVAVRPLDTRVLMTAELPFLVFAIDAMLGGAPSAPARERRLTEIDWALSRRVFSTLLHQLSIIWQDVADVQLEIAGIEPSLDNVQLAALSEPTLTLSVELRVGGMASTLALHLPYAAIAGIVGAFSQPEGAGDGPDGDTAQAVDAALRGVAITMRAEVAHTLMSVDDVLALRPGDVVRLGGRAADGVTVYADSVAVHRAKPGRSGSRRAVQVLGPAERGAC